MEIAKRSHELGERVKELNILYSISNLIEDPDISLVDIFQKTIELVPAAYQYPDITCARLTISGKEYLTMNFKKTKWKQFSEIRVQGEKQGMIEVYYKKEKKSLDEGPFLQEERDLIEAIADQLQGVIERKRTAEELKESEEKFRNISSSAKDAIVMIDNDGLITYWNKAAEKIFGFTAKEAIGMNLHQTIVPKNYHEASKKGMENFKNTGTGGAVGKTLELSALHKNGSKFPVEMSMSAVKIKGKWNAIGIVRDITERKRMEQKLEGYAEHLEDEVKLRTNELIQSEKMASLGQLVAGVAHEINNPLAYLRSNTEFLGEYLAEIKDKTKGKGFEFYDEIKELINSNIEGTNRIATITKTLKRFAQPDQEEKILSDINQGLKDTLIIVHNHLKHRVEVHEEYGDVQNVNCNLGQINQVFMNLILNASQAMESGDIWIKTWNEGKSVNVEIKDNGQGIPEDALNKIFDPFYTTKPEGTGLGLSLVYTIIQSHKGVLKVDSEVGLGTTMRIKLPVGE